MNFVVLYNHTLTPLTSFSFVWKKWFAPLLHLDPIKSDPLTNKISFGLPTWKAQSLGSNYTTIWQKLIFMGADHFGWRKTQNNALEKNGPGQ